ncbi:MAG TPA: trehalose utilization protein ThuA [Planctomycetaceae bacterium]|nr:trehalose utilization protein ThuA [Planctomycetaceae bacterium]
MASEPIQVTVWNEFIHEKASAAVGRIYPQGIHEAVAQALRNELGGAVAVRTATLEEPQHGLTEEVLAATDVLFWWGHAAHDRVEDIVVQRVHGRVLAGMGLVALHSAHASKIFRRLMGTSCMLRWREAAERERLWIVDPSHPIVDGLEGEFFELERTEMYGEYFDIPAPDEVFLISWFEGGEVFRSGCTFHRGKGKIVYFRPGHETFPIYRDANVRRVLANAARWAAPTGSPYYGQGRNIAQPLSPIAAEHDVDESLHRRA